MRQVAKLPLAGDPQPRHRPVGLCGRRRPARSQLRPVTVASFTEDAALVTSGVSNGDRIVTLGVQKLDAGERVRAVDER